MYVVFPISAVAFFKCNLLYGKMGWRDNCTVMHEYLARVRTKYIVQTNSFISLLISMQ